MFFGRTDAKAETPILWPPDVKNWLIWKDPDAGKDWRWEKGITEDEMAGWHHWLMDLSLSELRELVMDREAWRAAVRGVAKSRTRLSDWTELSWESGVAAASAPTFHSITSCIFIYRYRNSTSLSINWLEGGKNEILERIESHVSQSNIYVGGKKKTKKSISFSASTKYETLC